MIIFRTKELSCFGDSIQKDRMYTDLTLLDEGKILHINESQVEEQGLDLIVGLEIYKHIIVYEGQ